MIPLRPENQTLTQRIVLTMVIVVAILLALAFIGWVTGGWEAQGQMSSPSFFRSQYEDRFVQLDREAIDEAYKKHIIKLFDIWVTDYKKGEPPRAVIGANNARRAYTDALRAIEEREEYLRTAPH